MLVLALDTSSAAVTAALVEVDGAGPSGPDGTSTAAERSVVNARGHGELLAPVIESCLAEAMVTPRDLTAIVAGTGPGPFTGLRVGLVTAAVLSETLGIPAYGVCSLDGIAGRYALDAGGWGTGGAHRERTLLVATDARRKEVYWALYRGTDRVRGPEVSRPSDVPVDEATSMTGAGAALYRDVLGLPLLEAEYPSGPALVRRALDRVRERAPAEPLTPLYLRRPDAVEPGARKPVTP